MDQESKHVAMKSPAGKFRKLIALDFSSSAHAAAWRNSRLLWIAREEVAGKRTERDGRFRNKEKPQVTFSVARLCRLRLISACPLNFPLKNRSFQFPLSFAPELIIGFPTSTSWGFLKSIQTQRKCQASFSSEQWHEGSKVGWLLLF
jgi:hypothetical protein